MMLIYAHRGSSGVEPENTLLAFEQALADGADGIELDIHATSDGTPVVIHDRDIERTTDGSGHVDEMTLAELQDFDAGKGQRVPAFGEMLDLVAGQARLDIEIKQAGVERAVLDLLAQHPAAEWAISSFDWSILETVRSLSPRAELWPLTVIASNAAFAAAQKLDAAAIALHSSAVSADVAQRFWDADLDFVVWTVNQAPAAHEAQRLGAAGLITDTPAAIRASLAGASA